MEALSVILDKLKIETSPEIKNAFRSYLEVHKHTF